MGRNGESLTIKRAITLLALFALLLKAIELLLLTDVAGA